jgi:hypothetical protein
MAVFSFFEGPKQPQPNRRGGPPGVGEGVQSSAALTALFLLRVMLVEAFLGQSGGGQAAVTTGSPDLQSGPAAPTATGVCAGAGSPPSSRAGISEAECRLWVARAERERSSQSPPEYHGPQHATANQAEFEERKLRGACFACLNSMIFPSGLFAGPQPSSGGTSACPAPSPARTSDWAGSGSSRSLPDERGADVPPPPHRPVPTKFSLLPPSCPRGWRRRCPS